jgi:diadenosine tetraphosphate (Ap4A) HIT family hydrolase
LSTWRDAESWAKWVRGENCPICRSVAEGSAIAELEVSQLFMNGDAPIRGYGWLTFRRHVVELHELTEEEGASFMRDIRRSSRAIAAATEPVKLNYEIHGNTVPHLHLHIFPRYPGDPFEGAPINPRAIRGSVYESGEFERIRDRVIRDLDTR